MKIERDPGTEAAKPRGEQITSNVEQGRIRLSMQAVEEGEGVPAA